MLINYPQPQWSFFLLSIHMDDWRELPPDPIWQGRKIYSLARCRSRWKQMKGRCRTRGNKYLSIVFINQKVALVHQTGENSFCRSKCKLEETALSTTWARSNGLWVVKIHVSLPHLLLDFDATTKGDSSLESACGQSFTRFFVTVRSL